MAQEFTPELDASVLEAIKRRILEDEARQVAQARGAATSRNLVGSTYEAVRVGEANRGATTALADQYAALALQKATMAREERLIKEGQTYSSGEAEKGRTFQSGQAELEREFNRLEGEKQRAYASGENEKARAFEAQQQELNRQAQERAAKEEARGAMLGGIGNLVGNLGSAAISKGLFGGGGAAAGAGGAGGAAGAGTAGAGGAGGLGLGALGLGALGAGAIAAQTNFFSKRTGGFSGTEKIGSYLMPAITAPLAVGKGVGRILEKNNITGGSVGKVAKKIFCFDASTPILMLNGEVKPISEVKLGDETKGGRVCSVRVSETDPGTLFSYYGIKVTANHAVKETDGWKRVHKSIYALPLAGGGYVYSLATEGHRIYVPVHGTFLTFADELETDYYEDLTIDQSLEYLNRTEAHG